MERVVSCHGMSGADTLVPVPASACPGPQGLACTATGEMLAVVRRAAAALGVGEETIAPVGGASGGTWSCGEHFIRVSRAQVLDRELLAMAAASAAVPVPQALARADFDDGQGGARAAVLLTRLPGRPAGDLTDVSPDRARRRGEACAALHVALASLPPPAGVQREELFSLWPTTAPQACAQRACLLHLDLHPFNVLVDEADEVSGVLDWANTAAGPPMLERARTWSILTLDPAAAGRHAEPAWASLVQGWAQGAEFDQVPTAARVWACRLMLHDLAGRYDSGALEHVRRCARAEGGTIP